jgi:hypothetical protein
VVAAPQYRAAANTAMGWKNSNLRTEITRLLRRAGVSGSPRLFHSMRAGRQTELQREFPMHVVCSWLGNSQLTELAKRQKPLNQITEDARIFIQNWAEVEELLDAANEEERTQIIRHYIEVIELHASDTKGETGTYLDSARLDRSVSILGWNRFDLFRINPKFCQLFPSSLPVRVTSLSVTGGIVCLAIAFCTIDFPANARRQVGTSDMDGGCSSNLLHCQQFATQHIFVRRKLLTNAGTE